MGEPTNVSEVVERNIRALLLRRKHEDAQKTREERIADAVTRFTGSMRFVYIHIVLFGGWIVVNLGWIPFVPRFDESFVVLASLASVEAIFLSTFVLISQNRMAELEAQRADLDLQVSLLAEHEITRLIEMVEALMKHQGVQVPTPNEIDELKRDVKPERVVAEIQKVDHDGG